jgi:hypothetical protein
MNVTSSPERARSPPKYPPVPPLPITVTRIVVGLPCRG